MLHHILVPLDGSALAEEALDEVKQIIDPSGQITLLIAIDVPEYAPYVFYPVPITVESDRLPLEEALDQARAYLEHVASSFSQTTGLRVVLKTVVGEPAAAIVECASELGVDAIVMSTHGHSGLSRWLFGSVAQKVLTATPCPLVIVPTRAKLETRGVAIVTHPKEQKPA